MYLSIYLLAALAATLQPSTAKVIPETQIIDDETERIIFGSNAVEGQFPYACALFYNDNFICTCSVLSSLTVMTAAHCVVLDGQTQPASSFHAIANYDKSRPEVRIDFKEVTAHPDYDSDIIVNDIALFQASKAIPLTKKSNVAKICIARADTTVDEYANATAMGWGDTLPTPFLTAIPDILQYAEQRIVPNNQCSPFYLSTVQPEKICASSASVLQFYQGICQGDSGGPLVHLSADKDPVQIGIASYGNALADCGLYVPTVFTRVSAYNQWILETAQDSSLCSL